MPTAPLPPWLLMPLAIGTALLVDRLGEPPAWAHPVVGMGRWLGLFRLTRLPPAAGFLAGAAVWCVGAAACAALALAVDAVLAHTLPPGTGSLALLATAAVTGALLKPLLAWRMLADEVMAVEAALQRSLDDGRQQLSRLVSRNTAALTETEVREAALETLAENLNDSVVAPLFWFALAGLPGAAVYRFANTADAMWGYRDEREWCGKWAARADDVLSWLPARLTALALLPPRHWRALPREAARTPSPNSGWPMAALALRLHLRLGKPGVYALNAAGGAPRPGDMATARRLGARAMLTCGVVVATLAAGLRA